MLSNLFWVTQQVPTPSPQGHFSCPRHPSPASAFPLSLVSRGGAGCSQKCKGKLFYIFVNQVSEREKDPELISQEGIQFGFYGRGYWSYFCGELFICLLTQESGNQGIDWVLGPVGHWAHRTLGCRPGLGTGGGGAWTGCPRHAVRAFRTFLTLQAEGIWEPGCISWVL